MYITQRIKKFQKSINDLILVGDWKELESGNRMKRGGIDAEALKSIKH